jgi:hypothetical protein
MSAAAGLLTQRWPVRPARNALPFTRFCVVHKATFSIRMISVFGIA